MNENLKLLLKQIATSLNSKKITWAVGGSVMLNRYAIIDSYEEVVIVTTSKHFNKASKILKSLASFTFINPKSHFETKLFCEYIINDIRVCLFADLCILNSSNKFCFNFSKEAIGDLYYIDEEIIPLTHLSEWYSIYKLLPNGSDKVKAIKNYLEKI